MQRRAASLTLFACLLAGLAACSGVPLRAIPRLMSLQNSLLDMNPAEFMLAIQTDARVTPPPHAVPVMHVAIRPAVEGTFDPVEKALPMRFAVSSATAGLGLAAAPANRRWMIYSFTPESQEALARIQNDFKRIRPRQQGKGGGSVTVSIAQQDLAAKDPALANTHWESWLQTSAREGFYEIWSGTIGQLLKQSQSKNRPEVSAPTRAPSIPRISATAPTHALRATPSGARAGFHPRTAMRSRLV